MKDRDMANTMGEEAKAGSFIAFISFISLFISLFIHYSSHYSCFADPGNPYLVLLFVELDPGGCPLLGGSAPPIVSLLEIVVGQYRGF